MTENTSDRRADPLTWGHGPRLFEIFHEPTCPFSIRTLYKLDALLEATGPDRITLRTSLHSQPWHLFSGVIVRSALAASTLAEGKTAARKILTCVADHRAEFEPADHCSGPLMEVSPAHIIARIEDLAGLKFTDAYTDLAIGREVKRHTRYARQNGIHVSPSFMIDGLVQPDMSSGDAVSDWAGRLLTS